MRKRAAIAESRQPVSARCAKRRADTTITRPGAASMFVTTRGIKSICAGRAIASHTHTPRGSPTG